MPKQTLIGEAVGFTDQFDEQKTDDIWLLYHRITAIYCTKEELHDIARKAIELVFEEIEKKHWNSSEVPYHNWQKLKQECLK